MIASGNNAGAGFVTSAKRHFECVGFKIDQDQSSILHFIEKE